MKYSWNWISQGGIIILNNVILNTKSLNFQISSFINYINNYVVYYNKIFTGLQSSPSGSPSVVSQKVFALVRQADGCYVRHVLHRSIQPEHSHIEPVSLRRELEERVHADLANAERVSR